jgi:nitrite reductase/ring-hydroxylating ferredoxin subunit
MLRYIGEDSVIVSRQRDGEIAISLNVCTHRGMEVCRTERGNVRQFKCPYHGWAYGLDGRFLAAPFEKEMYGEVLNKPELGLRQARVATLGGVIFGNMDPEAPSLDEFLGDFQWYLECLLCRSDAGIEVVGPPQRATIRANWKGPAEQGSVDGYHTIGLHRSLEDLGFLNATSAAAAGLIGVDVSANGGGLRCVDMSQIFGYGNQLSEQQRLEQVPPIGMTHDMVPELANNLSPEQISLIATYPPAVGEAFPTFEFLFVPGPLATGEVQPIMSLHTWVPRGPSEFEMWTWVMVERDAPDELKVLSRKAALHSFGNTGIIEMDDGEAWPSQTRSARGAVGRRQKLRYLTFQGHNPPDGWPGPGQVHAGASRDDGQWQWWQRYFRFLLGEE